MTPGERIEAGPDPPAGAMATAAPTVSVVVPCRNESRYAEESIRSILALAAPPGGIEVIVADGRSDDGTRALLDRLSRAHANLHVLDNPAESTAAGMNLGIRAARGEYILILGAHTIYAPDYLLTCLQLMAEHPEVACVGGAIESRGRTPFGSAVAAAMSHPLGVGNAKHRYPDHEGYAEGACFPLFRRSTFDRIGFYDEALKRNQDDELNLRLALGGGRVFITARARSVYFVRDNPGALFRQYLAYGFWRVAVIRKHRRVRSLRQLAPVTLLSSELALLLFGLLLPGRWWLVALILPCAYAAALVVAAVGLIRHKGLRTAWRFPIAVAIMHAAYALGFVGGLLMRSPLRPRGDAVTGHTRS